MIELEAHDHSHCIDHVLSAAEAICQKRGVRLTEQRKSVLEILAASHVPSSAYEILDRLNRIRKDKGETALAPGGDLSGARIPAAEWHHSPHRKPQRLCRLHASGGRSRRCDNLSAL